MKWATRALIHFDRVISAWLIQRFIDKDATFVFLAEGGAAPADATLFGLPGARLAAHDSGASTFQRILEAYSIQDAALAEINRIVADVVGHVLKDPDRFGLEGRDPRAAGLLALAEGVMLVSANDHECLARSSPVYDALYARVQAQLVTARIAPAAGATVLEQTLKFARATALLRKESASFSSEAFERALRARQ